MGCIPTDGSSCDMDRSWKESKVSKKTGAFYPQPTICYIYTPLSNLELLEHRAPEEQQASGISPQPALPFFHRPGFGLAAVGSWRLSQPHILKDSHLFLNVM